MNYKRIYNQIIERAKQRRKLDCYVERHHIIPKCLGGTNDKNNIVELTAREHYICHKILFKLNPEHCGLFFGWHRMAFSENQYQERKIYITSKEYEILRTKSSFFQKEKAKKYWTVEKRKERSERNKGKGNPRYGVKSTNETRKKISQNHADFKNEKHPRARKVIIEGNIYNTCKEAVEKFEVCNATVLFRIKSKHWNWNYLEVK